MDQNICQSCAMPISSDELKGINKDATKNNDYCIYCYKDGNFQSSYGDIINYCLEHKEDWGMNMEKSEAEVKIKEFISSLKRWDNK